MATIEATADWWRADERGRADVRVETGSRVAFGALVTFTAILILSPQAWFPVLKNLRIAFLAAGVAILTHLLDRAVRRRAVEPLHPELAIATGLVCWSTLTIPLSYWPGGSIAELTDHLLKAIAFCWLIGTLVTTRTRLRLFLWLLALSSIPLSLTALQNYQSGVFLQTPSPLVQRIVGYNDGGSGLAANPNDLALMLNVMIPLMGALLASSRRIALRALAAGILTMSVAAVVVTFSRAGFLSLVGILVASLIAMFRRAPLFAIAAVLALAVIVPPLLPKGYLERINTITNISSDPTGSAQGRLGDLTVATALVVRNPLTGVGLGQNVLALNQERGATWRAVHNAYLQYAVDLGVPGLLLFLWLFVTTFRSARQVRCRSALEPAMREVGTLAEGVQIALVAFAVAAFFHPIAYQFYFFCIAGLALAVKNVYRTENPSSRLA